MRYLVTGGAGFLGTNLCKKLLSEGHSVLCVDDFSTGSPGNIEKLKLHPNFDFLELDITKPFYPDNIDAIFNLACPASPVHYQYNPIRTLKMGTLAMYNVLGIAFRLKIPVLQASTSEIYGDPEVHPQVETYWGNVNPIGPRSCYDEGKRVAESLCNAYKEHNNVSIRIARIFNTYGPYMDPDDGRVVSNFINQALTNSPITVYGDGKQTRSFCYVDDLVDGMIKLLSSDCESPVNLGNPSEINMVELANFISKLTKSKSEILFKPLPIDDPKRRKPSIEKAREILNWQPKVDIMEGLNYTIKWFSERNK